MVCDDEMEVKHEHERAGRHNRFTTVRGPDRGKGREVRSGPRVRKGNPSGFDPVFPPLGPGGVDPNEPGSIPSTLLHRDLLRDLDAYLRKISCRPSRGERDPLRGTRRDRMDAAISTCDA